MRTEQNEKKIFFVVIHQFVNKTNRTAIFPNTAKNTTIQTDVRNHCDPITSSQGLSASDSGKHFTSIFLKKYNEN